MLEYNFLVNFGRFCFASRLYMTPANARAELLVGVHAHLLRLSFIPALLVPFDGVDVARSSNVVASNSPLYGKHVDVISILYILNITSYQSNGSFLQPTNY